MTLAYMLGAGYNSVFIHMYKHTYIYIFVYVYMNIYTYTYIQHLHTYTTNCIGSVDSSVSNVSRSSRSLSRWSVLLLPLKKDQ